jgi:hypothetical protein
MIIRIIASTQTVELENAFDFKAFSVRVEGVLQDPAALKALLGRIADTSDHDHAWIRENVLRDWPSLTADVRWQDGLSKMIAAVEPYGWIDPVSGSIRAHIEYVA